MKEAFIKLKEGKRSYLIYAIGQKFIDLTETLINQLQKYSRYPVILYYSDGTVNFDSPNLIKNKFLYTGIEGLDLRGLDPAEVNNKILSTCLTKPLVVEDFIRNYDVDEFVFLDGDILVSPNIDSLFERYSDKISNYPLFLKYSWDVISVNGVPHVSDSILNIIGIDRIQKVPALCAGFFIGNINCKSFISDWAEYSSYQKKIDHWIENPGIAFNFNDETIANALIWLYDGDKYADPDFLWTWRYDSVKFAFDFYEGKCGELSLHESLQNHYKIPPEYEIPYGLSVIPVDKNKFLGTHGIKDLDDVKKTAEEIDLRFSGKIQKDDKLLLLLKSMDLNNKGVEICSFSGGFANPRLKDWNGKLYLIDIQKEASEDDYNKALESIKKPSENDFRLRMAPNHISDLFDDESLDFVYIDSDHTYESIKNNIKLWHPKVKKGGILTGRNYLLLNCYNKENYKKGIKDQDVWIWEKGNYEEKNYAGVFGVNPAVDEFLDETGYELNKTEEFNSTWWIIKR